MTPNDSEMIEKGDPKNPPIKSKLVKLNPHVFMPISATKNRPNSWTIQPSACRWQQWFPVLRVGDVEIHTHLVGGWALPYIWLVWFNMVQNPIDDHT